MFRHWGYGGPWIFFGLFRLLFWVVVIGGLFYVFRRRPYWHEHHEARSGESVLAERYAKGEISEEEYRQRLTVLRESRR